MDSKIKLESNRDSVIKQRTFNGNLSRRHTIFTDFQIHTTAKLILTGEPATQVGNAMGLSAICAPLLMN